jgi:hypothetical protein
VAEEAEKENERVQKVVNENQVRFGSLLLLGDAKAASLSVGNGLEDHLDLHKTYINLVLSCSVHP